MAEENSVAGRPISVILADDHAVVRRGVRAVLEHQGGAFRIVAEVADVPTMIREVRAQKPDVLVLDLTMPGQSGLEGLPPCFDAHPSLAVAVLTMRDEPEYARKAFRAGVRSYVLKEAEPNELVRALRMTAAGESYLHPRLGATVMRDENGPDSGGGLTEREREVVKMIAEGHTNGEIAERLGIGERTVKTDRARAREKLGVTSRSEMTSFARRSGLLR